MFHSKYLTWTGRQARLAYQGSFRHSQRFRGAFTFRNLRRRWRRAQSSKLHREVEDDFNSIVSGALEWNDGWHQQTQAIQERSARVRKRFVSRQFLWKHKCRGICDATPSFTRCSKATIRLFRSTCTNFLRTYQPYWANCEMSKGLFGEEGYPVSTALATDLRFATSRLARQRMCELRPKLLCCAVG